jgi:hypothetical protein
MSKEYFGTKLIWNRNKQESVICDESGVIARSKMRVLLTKTEGWCKGVKV